MGGGRLRPVRSLPLNCEHIPASSGPSEQGGLKLHLSLKAQTPEGGRNHAVNDSTLQLCGDGGGPGGLGRMVAAKEGTESQNG